VLVDTSVWVDHLRRRNPGLALRLELGQVRCHPFVIGELACGNLRRRDEILSLLSELPQVPIAEHEEVLVFVESNRLVGTGLGWVDVHLLASAALASLPLWTRDRRLAAAAARLELSAGS
jgi:hypothetical protein